MKKIVLCLGICVLGLVGFGQKGLNGVIIEKYYVSNAVDSALSLDTVTKVSLLPGSVTYRIFLDMLPGYKLESIYGDGNHELRFETSTYFYNNSDYGSNIANSITVSQDKNTVVMLDSWLSVGAACKGYYGVLKSKDDGVNTLVNTDGGLKNNDTSAGIPLTVQDGMILAKAPMPQLMTTKFIGLDGD